MNTGTVTLELPARLYADLQSLAAEEQIDLGEIIARLITMATQHRVQAQSPTSDFQHIPARTTDLAEQAELGTSARVQLTPASFSEKDRARRLRIVRRLYGIWSEDDEVAFRRMRRELWSQWQPHSFAWNLTSS